MTSPGDTDRAAAEADARSQLLGAGGADLPRPPWLHGSQPPSAVDLVHLALWRARRGAADDADLLAALRLLPAARAELDALEAGLLFTARGLDLTWGQMAQAVGLNSPQACQQRLDRLLTRQDRPESGGAG